MRRAIYWCRSSGRAMAIEEAPGSNPPCVKVWYTESKTRPEASFENFIGDRPAHMVPTSFDKLVQLYSNTMRQIL